MKLINFSLLTVVCLLSDSTTESKSIFENPQNANQLLKRNKRANGSMEEMTKKSNFVRECLAEVCSPEEYVEFAENLESNSGKERQELFREANTVEMQLFLKASRKAYQVKKALGSFIGELDPMDFFCQSGKKWDSDREGCY